MDETQQNAEAKAAHNTNRKFEQQQNAPGGSVASAGAESVAALPIETAIAASANAMVADHSLEAELARCEPPCR